MKRLKKTSVYFPSRRKSSFSFFPLFKLALCLLILSGCPKPIDPDNNQKEKGDKKEKEIEDVNNNNTNTETETTDTTSNILTFEIWINNSNSNKDDYIAWSPIPCQIRVNNATTNQNVSIRLKNKNNSGGQLLFSNNDAAYPNQEELTLSFNANTPQTFFVAGKAGFPSMNDKDAIIEILDTATGDNRGEQALMIRVRKNANNLTAAERDRFLNALVTLNVEKDMYRVYIDMHLDNSSREGHFGSGFLPWHRAYLLDLERELQNIDPSVCIPYWKFDEAAPNLFHKDFIGGLSTTQYWAELSDANPLAHWRIASTLGIQRNLAPNSWTSNKPPWINSDATVIAFGEDYQRFLGLEQNPHGNAHVAFQGWLRSLGTAVQDPLFFLLHCNVDRLWAQWQYVKDMHDPTDEDCYWPQGLFNNNGDIHIGHFLDDTLWPWNGNTSTNPWGVGNRPRTAPGGNFPSSPGYENQPGLKPTVKKMIDYNGKLNTSSNLNFAYDIIPFQ